MNEKFFLYEFKLLMQKYAVTFDQFDFSYEGRWCSIITNSDGEIYLSDDEDIIFAPLEYDNFVDPTDYVNKEDDYEAFHSDDDDEDGDVDYFL